MNRFLVFILSLVWVINPIMAQTSVKDEVVIMLNQASKLKQNGDYAGATRLFAAVGKQMQGLNNEEERQIYVFSQIMVCSCYYANKQYSEGYRLAKNLLLSSLNNEEKVLLNRQYVLNGYMVACNLMHRVENNNTDYKRAREVLKELLPYADEQLKEYVQPKIPMTWYLEGVGYQSVEKYHEALACYENALKGFEEQTLTGNEISVLKQMASVNAVLDNSDKAILYYEQALLKSQQIHADAEQMEIAEQLYYHYEDVGQMKRRVYYASLMKELFESTKDDDACFIYYSYKGKEACKHGQFSLSELWYQKAMEIAEEQKENGVNKNYYLSHFQLGNLYASARRFDEAYEYLQLSLGERRDDVNIDNYLTYILIAQIYQEKGDSENFQKCLNDLFDIEPYIDEPRQLSKLYATRGRYYNDIGDYESALRDYIKADEIMAKKYPIVDSERVSLYAMMGGIEHRLNHFEESENYYNLYAKTIKEIYGKKSLNNIKAQIYLANAQGFANHITEGCKSYSFAVAELKEIIEKRLPFMSAAERESFWEPLSSLFTSMTPYALKAKLHQTEYTKTCYDALLLSKAFLLDSERSLYDIIKSRGDKKDMQTYLSMTALKNQIKEWEKDYAVNADSILAFSNRVNQLEDVLMKKCKSVGDMTSFMEVDYEAVKKALDKHDILIDFTDFVTETDGRKYAAYIIDKKQKKPLLKPLFAESQVDSLGIGHPALFYDEEDFVPEIIKLLWNPIKEHIAEGATIYYVPSQMLFQVCLESLPLEDGTLLGDHYNFVRLSSARELVRKQNGSKSRTSSAVLYGGLQYDLEFDVMVENAKQYDLSSLMTVRGGDIVRGDSIFRELPGSKVEIERITEILKQVGFAVTPYKGMNGTEESFLSMHGKSPQILHLATHGFYYTPTEAEEVDYLRGYSDAMSLSGLIMSGGNAAWRGKKLPEGTLGGVLTANNISRLDLSGTDMVVLSACQTGQGNATAEGLYGLQRAFKKAGVGTMVMTLWSVSDKVATEFMIKFYESLVENDWNKRKAFKQAKSQIRGEYPDPYHWAAFVMLD